MWILTCYVHWSFRNGPGQQCCYDRDGNIITGPSSGGRIDSVAPVDVKTTIQHLFADVAPYYFCCTPEILQNCGKLYEFRPSDDCSRTRPPRPGKTVVDDSVN